MVGSRDTWSFMQAALLTGTNKTHLQCNVSCPGVCRSASSDTALFTPLYAKATALHRRSLLMSFDDCYADGNIRSPGFAAGHPGSDLLGQMRMRTTYNVNGVHRSQHRTSNMPNLLGMCHVSIECWCQFAQTCKLLSDTNQPEHHLASLCAANCIVLFTIGNDALARFNSPGQVAVLARHPPNKVVVSCDSLCQSHVDNTI